jgi:lactate dehydrogenase-like 2-hydroxyacid dehydrogenase
VEVLMTQRLLESCMADMESRFTVHRLFEAENPDRLIDEVAPRIRAIAGGPAPATLIDRLPGLEIIAHFGVGYDSVDVAAARRRNIRVTNTPDVLNDAVAEMTIALMLALARRVPQADAYVRAGKWEAEGNYPLQSELRGRTLGILGLGRIGKEIAARAQAMKMAVVYHGRREQKWLPYRYYPNLIDMARDADWLVVIAPGGNDTAGLVSRAVLEALGSGGRLVNMARGSLVDEAALVEMLADGRLGGAALDVFAQEPVVPPTLYALDNVVLSPHQGSATDETREAMGALVSANLLAHSRGEPLLSPVA